MLALFKGLPVFSNEFAIDDVKAAFFLVFRLPPPSAGTLFFSRYDGSRTTGAANTGKIFIVQFVVGYGVLPQIVPNIIKSPVYEWINFQLIIP